LHTSCDGGHKNAVCRSIAPDFEVSRREGGRSDDWRKPMTLNAAIRMFDLVGTAKRPVDALAQLRSGIRGIQALIWIHHARRVVVGGHLPA
jgi:hypothetical protein